MKHALTLAGLLLFFSASAQVAVMDSLPFTLDSGLLVFNVKLNGVDVNAAFDTGAGITVSNSALDGLANLTRKKSKTKIQDSNQTVQKIERATIQEFQIGVFSIKDLSCLTVDMPYLYCNRFLLLGQDVIRSLNWKFDFDRKWVYVSKNVFDTDNTALVWPITYGRNQRPFTTIALNEGKPLKCLIDAGFAGVLEISRHEKEFADYYTARDSLGHVKHYVKASMGLNGLGISRETNYLVIDSVQLGGRFFPDVYGAMADDTDTKLGIQFFNRFCHSLILNNTANTFYLALKENKLPYTFPGSVQVSIKSSAFVVTGLRVDNKDFTVGETVRKVNGKTVQEYASECDYVMWNYSSKKGTHTIEKMDGTVIMVQNDGQ